MKLRLGIDPGRDGCLCVWDPDMNRTGCRLLDAPTREVVVRRRGQSSTRRLFDVPAMAAMLRPYAKPTTRAVVEAAETRGGLSAPSVLMTGLGQAYWVGILAALEIEYVEVRASIWKADLFGAFKVMLPPQPSRKLGVLERKREMDRHRSLLKKASCQLAARLFPDSEGHFAHPTVDHNRAEAALLAFWLDGKIAGAWSQAPVMVQSSHTGAAVGVIPAVSTGSPQRMQSTGSSGR